MTVPKSDRMKFSEVLPGAKPDEKLKPCICNSKSSSLRPPVCRKKGCDGILTEGIMRQCSRYISEDDDVFKGEPVWRGRKEAKI